MPVLVKPISLFCLVTASFCMVSPHRGMRVGYWKRFRENMKLHDRERQAPNIISNFYGSDKYNHHHRLLVNYPQIQTVPWEPQKEMWNHTCWYGPLTTKCIPPAGLLTIRVALGKLLKISEPQDTYIDKILWHWPHFLQKTICVIHHVNIGTGGLGVSEFW